MRVCPTCHLVLRADALRCPADGAVSETFATLPPGARLGAYRIDRVLGDGGMGFVYEATHELLARRTAIKMLRPELAHHPQIVTRFLNEAKAVNVINHDNIVNVYDYGQNADDSVYFVMEYLEGETLDVLMRKRRPMSTAMLVHLFAQIGRALAAAHGKQIVHRDLKPANVFVVAREDNPYFVKLLDFGIAQLRGAGAVAGLTLAGSVMGTPQYMSPEQVSGGEVDARSDVWAMGVMLYRAATGEAPFSGEEFAELAPKILYQSPRPPSELVAMPQALSRLIMSCLEREVAARCPSIEAMLAGLREVMREAGLDDDAVLQAVLADAGAMSEAAPAGLQPTSKAAAESHQRFLINPPRGTQPARGDQLLPAPATPRSRRRWLPALAALVLAVGAGGAYALTGKGKARASEAQPLPGAQLAASPAAPPSEAPPSEAPLTAAQQRGDAAEVRRLAEELLRRALAHDSLQHRGFALEALERARTAATIPLLSAALDQLHTALLNKAAAAALALDARTLSPKLRAAFQRASGALQVELAAAMVRLGDLDARAALGEALRDSGAPALTAALALAELGDDAGLATLERALARSAEGTRAWRDAALGLARLGQARGSELLARELARPEPERAVAAAAALAQVGDARGERALRNLLADRSFARRGGAAVELARRGEVAALAFVAEGLTSATAQDRLDALAVCGALGAGHAKAHTASLANAADHDESPAVRYTALAVLLGL